MPIPDPPSLWTVRLSIRTEPDDTWDPHGRYMVAVNMTPGRAYGTDWSCAGGARLVPRPRHVTGGSSATRRDHREDWQH